MSNYFETYKFISERIRPECLPYINKFIEELEACDGVYELAARYTLTGNPILIRKR